MSGPKPAVMTSPFRKEIEEMLIEGKSSRTISKWLKEQGEIIGYTAINNYKNNHFDVQSDAIQKYNDTQSKKRKTRAVNRTVKDIEKIDQIIDNIDPEVVKEMDKKDQIRAVSPLLQTKYKILGVIDDKQSVEVNVNNNQFNPNTQKEIIDEEEGSD